MKRGIHARSEKGGFIMKAAISGTCLAAGIVVAAMLAIPMSAAVAESGVAVTHEAASAMAASDIPQKSWFEAQAENDRRIKEEAERKEAEKAAQEAEAARIAAEEAAAQEAAIYEEPAYYGGGGGTRGNPNGLNSFDGTYEYNGKTETFYSNRAVYDDQLWVDDDGFWRTDDGHYVVASVDYAEGTEIEISQGKAIVMDGGNEPGNVDVHTNW